MNFDLGSGMIWMINTSSKTLEDMLKTYKYKKESKAQDGKSLDEDSQKNNGQLQL